MTKPYLALAKISDNIQMPVIALPGLRKDGESMPCMVATEVNDKFYYDVYSYKDVARIKNDTALTNFQNRTAKALTSFAEKTHMNLSLTD